MPFFADWYSFKSANVKVFFLDKLHSCWLLVSGGLSVIITDDEHKNYIKCYTSIPTLSNHSCHIASAMSFGVNSLMLSFEMKEYAS